MGLADWLWPRSRPQIGLAFSPNSLDLYRLHGPRELSFESVPLEAEALRASAREPNLDAPAALARRCQEVLTDLPEGGTAAVMLLPDLSVTATVVQREDPTAALSSLSGLASERLVVDSWSAPGGGTLATAIAKVVVAQYKAVREALGLEASWIDTPSTALLPRLAALSEHQSSLLSAEIQTFASHYTLALFRGGELFDYRRRLVLESDLTAPLEELNRHRQHLGEPRVSYVGVSGARAALLSSQAHEFPEFDACGVRFDGESALYAQAVSDLLTRF